MSVTIKSNHQRGFTIVELLIVIVVIAILAAISIVAYNGIQQRASDAKIKSAASQVIKAIQIYSADNGGSSLNTLGWQSVETAGVCSGGQGGYAGYNAYICTLEKTLRNKDLLPNNFMQNLPPNKKIGASAGDYTLMFYPCTTPNQYILIWFLSNPSASDSTSYSSNMYKCGLSAGAYTSSFGMQAASVIEL